MNIFEESLVKYFGKEGLKKIQSVRVGIAGLGGLGSNAATALVRCGFKNLLLCDFDKVDISNLNRQGYFLDQVGLPKTEALKINLLRINPDLKLELRPERLTALNAEAVLKQCDAIVEAFDGAEDKKMLMQTFWEGDKFFVSASGIAGYNNADSITTRKLKKNIILVGDGHSEISLASPPCAPRVLVAAAKQASVILSWALSRY